MIAPLPPGTLVFNRYRVVGLAGQGEFGLTYLAQDQKRFDELCMLREFTPLKQEPASLENLRQYFHQEAALLYELQHPQLPHYRIMFVHGDRLYLVRDYIVGKSCSAMLNERRAEGRAFSQAEVMQVLLQTLPVLTYLHRLHIVHENLSPHSIVIRREEQIPVLIDLGMIKRLAMQLQLHPILPDASIGRIGYLAPEQEKGAVPQPGTDLFAVGAIGVSLLLGKEPQEPAHRWLRNSNWEAETGIQPDFARVLKRLLHPNPQKRFLSAQQVMRALEPLASVVSYYTSSEAKVPVSVASPMLQQSVETQPVVQPSDVEPIIDALPLVRQPHPQTPVPVATGKPPARPVSRPPKRRKKSSRPKADMKASAILVVSIALLVSVVSFRALSWVQTESDKTPAPANTIASPTDSSPTVETATPSPPPPQIPTRESGTAPAPPGTVAATSDGSAATEMDTQFLSDLTDELFYTKYPNLAGQKLTDDQKDLQNEWKAMSENVLTKLKGLSPEVRSKLGRYERSDYDRWTAPGSGASLNSRELNVLVNNRFGELFPDQKGKSLNPKTFGQVWYALAEEELNKLKPAN